ncbi:hypothetical protein GUITHDRAFT_115432 [Guillardia theta CCMP2712]|uniref:Uncharacterized protein n=1 Tax=Guillardia theta (strain CCMP2712) TaxID=905079 RepID=L1IQA4_GUITC|nr:hypothetical protein GUITHDRAFT_115432 [Guillardia theta CCMP2712]EKX38466.1 hypothetical protein GUITHDRAFT_115432 [Guillardia theta CCMP2712]|eukprot:XP_005825446.1 hypothetical protein GUITHDRAFT_115432 [Guillardia theta CCMP2712]
MSSSLRLASEPVSASFVFSEKQPFHLGLGKIEYSDDPPAHNESLSGDGPAQQESVVHRCWNMLGDGSEEIALQSPHKLHAGARKEVAGTPQKGSGRIVEEGERSNDPPLQESVSYIKTILEHTRQSLQPAEHSDSVSEDSEQNDRELKEISMNKPAPSGAKPRKNKNRDFGDDSILKRSKTIEDAENSPPSHEALEEVWVRSVSTLIQPHIALSNKQYILVAPDSLQPLPSSDRRLQSLKKETGTQTDSKPTRPDGISSQPPLPQAHPSLQTPQRQAQQTPQRQAQHTPKSQAQQTPQRQAQQTPKSQAQQTPQRQAQQTPKSQAPHLLSSSSPMPSSSSTTARTPMSLQRPARPAPKLLPPFTRQRKNSSRRSFGGSTYSFMEL